MKDLFIALISLIPFSAFGAGEDPSGSADNEGGYQALFDEAQDGQDSEGSADLPLYDDVFGCREPSASEFGESQPSDKEPGQEYAGGASFGHSATHENQAPSLLGKRKELSLDEICSILEVPTTEAAGGTSVGPSEHKEAFIGPKQIKYRYRCEGCGDRFATSILLRAHRQTHHGEEPIKCTVSGCKFAFYGEIALIEHTQLFHPFVCLFKCEYCGEAYTHHGYLRVHLRKNHLGVSSRP